VLDQERELQNIPDAVEPAQRHENCEARVLEVGDPAGIGSAVASDAYHVLRLSCHGLPGALELEDEEGSPQRAASAALLEPIRQAGRARACRVTWIAARGREAKWWSGENLMTFHLSGWICRDGT
jgi:hypothetical protein